MKIKSIFERHTGESRYLAVSSDTRGPRTWCGVTAAILAAIIAVPAFAEGEKTVTSKSYVDAQDALKQDKITAGTEGSVVIYDGTDANGQTVFDERGIYEGDATYTNDDADKLITAELVHDLADTIENTSINQQVLIGVDENGAITCQASDTCELWQISTTTTALAAAGTFSPLTAPSCKAYGESIPRGETSLCCSRVQQPCSRNDTTCLCGCAEDTDCPGGQTCDTTARVCSNG